MAIFNATQLSQLRGSNHRTDLYATFWQPDILWSARIDDATITKGETTIVFDGGSGAAYTSVESLQEVWVGSSLNQDDIGRLRIKSISSGDGGVTGTLTVAFNALEFADDQFLTFMLNYPVKPKYPVLGGTPSAPIFNKDGDITYTDQNENLNPVVIAGGNRADFIDDTLGYWEINSVLPESYAVHPGATISSYSVSSLSLVGSPTIAVNGGTGVGTIRFTTPGQYWLKYTITDSAGNTQDSYRFYYAHSTDRTSEHFPFYEFTCNSITGSWEEGGWVTGLKLHDRATLDDIDDEVPAILWQKAYYQDTQTQITLQPDTDTTLVAGYTRKDTTNQQLQTNLGTVDFEILTVQAVIANHYMFSISLEAKAGSPTDWFEYRSELTVGRAIHHFWLWHSTIMETTDVIGLMDNTDLRPYAELEDGNLYSMANVLSRDVGIRQHLVSDQAGRIHLTPDLQLLNDTERAALTDVQPLNTAWTDPADLGEDITIIRRSKPETAWAKTSGFSWDGTFVASIIDPATSKELCPSGSCPDPDPHCSAAPGGIQPSDWGGKISTLDRQTLRQPDGQTHCDEIAGRLFAKENNEYPEVRLKFHGNYHQTLDFAFGYYWTLTLQATDTERDIIWVDKPLYLKQVNSRPDTTNGTLVTDVVFEPEMSGRNGDPGVCLDELPDNPAETDLTGEQQGSAEPVVTASSVHYLDTTVPEWDLLTAENVWDMVKDPFWQSRQGSTDPKQSILWRTGTGYIKRSTDGGDSWVDVTPAGNAPNDAGDVDPVPWVAVLFEHIDPSRVNIGEFAVVGNYLNTNNLDPNFGQWHSWLLYTDDDGTTWDTVAIGVEL